VILDFKGQKKGNTMIEDIKKMALEAYVLHIMMWDELSKRSFYLKHRLFDSYIKHSTDAMKLHKAYNCEFCGFASYFNVTFNQDACVCDCCPSKVGRGGGCLGGLFSIWTRSNSIDQMSGIARKIRDIELVDWFKELIS
jgi:pantothenate kinase